MTVRARTRGGLLAACVVVALVVAWVAGNQGGGPSTGPSAAVGSVRLGPEPGEPVADYLRRIGADLPAPGTSVLALVQLDHELSTGDALALAGAAHPVTAVFRVPLDRVQTALRFQPLEPGVPVATALDSARQRAAASAAGDVARATGRQEAVARWEASALGDPTCACVVALVVSTDRATLDGLSAAAAVRAVHAAPSGVTAAELALAPLLPDQRERADPLPDDGAVPDG